MFESHKLNKNGFEEMEQFKKEFADAVRQAITRMPDSREKSIFLTKVEEAVFFGAKAIASKSENYTEIKSF